MSTKSERPKPRVDLWALRRAFERAEIEREELARLKASGKPFACLEFRPEALASADAHTNPEGAT